MASYTISVNPTDFSGIPTSDVYIDDSITFVLGGGRTQSATITVTLPTDATAPLFNSTGPITVTSTPVMVPISSGAATGVYGISAPQVTRDPMTGTIRIGSRPEDE